MGDTDQHFVHDTKDKNKIHDHPGIGHGGWKEQMVNVTAQKVIQKLCTNPVGEDLMLVLEQR